MSCHLLGIKSADDIRAFEEMRRNRNAFLYEAGTFVSSHEVKEALALAEDYLRNVEEKLTRL